MVLTSRCVVLLSPPLVFVVPALCMLGMARSLVPVAWCPRCEEDWPRSVVACVGSLLEGKSSLEMHTDGCLPSTWVLMFWLLPLGIWYHLHSVGFENHKGQKRNNCSGFRDMILSSLMSDKHNPLTLRKKK